MKDDEKSNEIKNESKSEEIEILESKSEEIDIIESPNVQQFQLNEDPKEEDINFMNEIVEEEKEEVKIEEITIEQQQQQQTNSDNRRSEIVKKNSPQPFKIALNIIILILFVLLQLILLKKFSFFESMNEQ